MNTRTTKAVRFYAWRNNDCKLQDELYEWSSACKEMALRTDKGKPMGVFPASVQGTTELFNGDGANWYDANMYWTYYNWESNGSVRFYDQLLFSYLTHHDESLLKPLKLTLAMIKKYAPQKRRFLPGEAGWAASIILRSTGFWNTVLQYRVFTGDKSYDDLLIRYGNPYSKFLLTGNKKYLTEGLNSLLADIRYNTPLRTSEVIHTDRVRTFDIITLKGMLTGNYSYETESPFLPVTYEKTSPDLTMLVEKNSPDELGIRFYSFSELQKLQDIRCWLLEKGHYSVRIMKNGNEIIDNFEIEIKKRGERVQIQLPPKTEVFVSIEKEK